MALISIGSKKSVTEVHCLKKPKMMDSAENNDCLCCNTQQ